VVITQALGGSYTVIVHGNMARIAGADADAIGREVTASTVAPEPGQLTEEQVYEALRACYDPEIPVNIVELGLVYDMQVLPLPGGGHRVEIKMTLTAPGCGMGEVLVQDVRDKVEIVPTVARANVELVFDPPWNQTMMSDEARLQTGMM
jgi:probable FeS assembly SUF system protein SufT